MIIGVDLDNTIVCYDALFKTVALERGLAPADLPPFKRRVRDHLQESGMHDLWTQLQGIVYGPRMNQAPPYEGALAFFAHCRRAAVPTYIISHRTPYAQIGEKHDLYQAARAWLSAHGLFDPPFIFFEPTQDQKLARLVEVGCTHFIDDLPEFLNRRDFPATVERILFDPNHVYGDCQTARHADSWPAVEKILWGKAP
jgi:hypothetical protein